MKNDEKDSSPSLQDRIGEFSRRHRRWVHVGLVVAILFLGILVHLNDLNHWTDHRDSTFVEGEPILTTFDGWFYLSLAKDLMEGTYHPTDEKRGIPQSPPRPYPPPLLSVLAAGIADITPLSPGWTGALLPVFLGPLIVVPIFLLGRLMGGTIMDVSASLLSVSYPFAVTSKKFPPHKVRFCCLW